MNVERVLGVRHVAPAASGEAMLKMAEEAGLKRPQQTQPEIPSWTTDGPASGCFSTAAANGDRISGWMRFVAPLLADPKTREKITVIERAQATRLLLRRTACGGTAARSFRAVGVEVHSPATVAERLRRCGTSLGSEGSHHLERDETVLHLLLAADGAEIVVCAGAIDTPKVRATST